jgi:hypothetical protein
MELRGYSDPLKVVHGVVAQKVPKFVDRIVMSHLTYYVNVHL